jgi:hypothetical protein
MAAKSQMETKTPTAPFLSGLRAFFLNFRTWRMKIAASHNPVDSL